jgi:hypothetical protein
VSYQAYLWLVKQVKEGTQTTANIERLSPY